MFRALIISFLLIPQHNHVSIGSISYVPGTDSLKVFCQINFKDFLNDLQTIDDDRNLRTLFSRQPFPSDLINQYFNTKVFIYINKKLLTGKLLKADRTGNEINMYLLYRVDKKPRTITVRNLILTHWYIDQTNLMIIKINDFEKGIRFTPEKNEVTFNVK
jgi:hypothetical protein